jgi:tetratricopeptide (TPR) repeat protein
MPPSRLNIAQKRFLLVVVSLGLFMVADTLYLLLNRLAEVLGIGYFAITELSLSRFYQIMVLSHTGIGLLLVTIATLFVVWHLPAVWRRHRQKAIYTGLVTLGLGLLLAVTGLLIVSAASNRDTPWAYWSHVAAAALVPFFYLAHRRFSLWRPEARSYRTVPLAIVSLLFIAVLLHGLTYDRESYTQAAVTAFAAGKNAGPGSKQRRPADYASSDFVPAGFVPSQSPFFPAATTTTTGDYLPSRIITRGDLSRPEKLQRDIDKYGFAVVESIGSETCARCHAGTVAQWEKSAHRFASFNNPFYEASLNGLRENRSGNPAIDAHIVHFEDLAGKEGFIKSKWCSGCHDPALMLAGKMTEEIDRTTPQAQAGLTCLACHAIDQIHGRTGNGNYNIADEQEDPYLFADARKGLPRFVHDTALKARPIVHKRQMLKPFFRTAEYCATCHKVSLDTPLNDYRWLRGQDEYDNWHDSGVALNASRTFYLPGYKRLCQDCHMPYEPVEQPDVSAKDGLIRSHRFLAVNTALPFLRGDQETIERTERFLQAEKLSVDIFALHPEGKSSRYAIDRTRPSLDPGASFTFDIVVRNLGVGHTFPGGTTDSNEAWLEVSALDAQGRPLAISGLLQEDGHVDPAAHFYRALMVDRQGRAIRMRNAQDIIAPVYVRVIGPGAADVAHFDFRLPADYSHDSVTLKARLLWRKFDRPFTEFAYRTNPEGFRSFDDVPELPISVIAEDRVDILVGTVTRGLNTPAEEDWVRFNDYGIALLLQGDTQAATRVFEQVSQLSRNRLDGPRNLARTAFRDGDLETAYAHLRRCEELTPGDPQTAWVWGVVLQEDGRYEEAILAYRRVLHDFPEDRASWRNLGRVLYLDGRFDEALEALDQVLAIDPEDRIAYYHRMLALRALGRASEAALAEKAYQYYQIDESAQEVTRRYRLQHPLDNREVLQIHVHPLQATSEAEL